MLGNNVNEFKKFVENNTIAVFSAMYRVEYIVDQAGGTDNLTQADHKIIAQQLIFKGMPASLPGVIIDAIITPEKMSIESEILGEALANIARANEAKIKGLYDVLDCMLSDDVKAFKAIDSVDMTNNQMMVNCDFFNAYKIFNHYLAQTLGKGGEKRSAEQQQAIENNLDKIYEEVLSKQGIIIEAPALIEKQPEPLLLGSTGLKKDKTHKSKQNTDYLNFDPIVESFGSASMQKAGADDLVSNPLTLEPEFSDFQKPIEASVTTSETTQQPNKQQNAGYNFAKIFLYATAAVGASYLAYKVAQQTSIVENAKEFAAEAAKELAIYALVDKEAGSKMGGRQ
jgi:hypothetical protein